MRFKQAPWKRQQLLHTYYLWTPATMARAHFAEKEVRIGVPWQLVRIRVELKGGAPGHGNRFSSGDRHRWFQHIESMFFNVFFEQGVVGADYWGLMVAAALWRTSFGAGSSQPLAPALAAGLAGMVVVGLFDSLLDAPRLAWAFYLLILVALFLPDRMRRRQTIGGGRVAVGVVLAISVCGIGLEPSNAWAADAEVARQVIRVGPEKPIKKIADAARVAKDGALIEVDAGAYFGDVAVWTQDRLTIRAVGGRVRLVAPRVRHQMT
jgi:hypothetical protein